MVVRSHAMPARDLVKHEVSTECACGPSLKVVMREDGLSVWIVGHHALEVTP